jgi:DNA-binding GntR family transcriptional regulator
MDENSPKEAMYDALFIKILSGEYEEGDRLKEADLADEFNLSRTPVREVLKLLAADGLVHLLPNRGATVFPLTPDDIEEIYEIRKSLELLALSFSIDRISLTELGKLRKRMVNIKSRGDYMEALSSDVELHSLLVESSGKRRLSSMLRQLLHLMRKFRSIGFHEQELLNRVTTEHIDLIDALTARDREKAKKILSDHLDRSKESALKVMFLNSNS